MRGKSKEYCHIHANGVRMSPYTKEHAIIWLSHAPLNSKCCFCERHAVLTHEPHVVQHKTRAERRKSCCFSVQNINMYYLTKTLPVVIWWKDVYSFNRNIMFSQWLSHMGGVRKYTNHTDDFVLLLWILSFCLQLNFSYHFSSIIGPFFGEKVQSSSNNVNKTDRR